MTMTLVFATNNAHKLEEVRQILPSVYRIMSLHEIGFEHEIDETGDTLEANSLLKAQTVWQWLQTHYDHSIDGVFADDTGLEIEALNNEPGVRTARWAGEDKDDAANRKKALTLLSGQTNRTARFRTVITLIRLIGTTLQTEQVEGCVHGLMAEEEVGDHGFGYDAVFVPEGYDKTFAQLPAEVKNSISHRARAVEQLKLRLV